MKVKELSTREIPQFSLFVNKVDNNISFNISFIETELDLILKRSFLFNTLGPGMDSNRTRNHM